MPMNYLPSRNILLILIFGGGIFLFVILAIFPNYMSFTNMEREIDTLRNKIEEQKILSPIFEDLSKKAQFTKPASLPFPPPEKLSKNDTNKISPIIQSIVEKKGFTLEDIDTDIESLMSETGVLKMSVHMIGAFNNLRDVLLDLGALPYLKHIEIIQINSFRDANKINLSVWISQEQ
jgi:hypothetical protein